MYEVICTDRGQREYCEEYWCADYPTEYEAEFMAEEFARFTGFIYEVRKSRTSND